MFADAVGVMDKVTAFLGLCKYDWSTSVQKIHNKRNDGYHSIALPLSELSRCSPFSALPSDIHVTLIDTRPCLTM